MGQIGTGRMGAVAWGKRPPVHLSLCGLVHHNLRSFDNHHGGPSEFYPISDSGKLHAIWAKQCLCLALGNPMLRGWRGSSGAGETSP